MAKCDAPRCRTADDPRPPRPAARRTITAAILLTGASVLVAACTTSISGVARPEATPHTGSPSATAAPPPGAAPGSGSTPAELLLPVDRFPEPYSAVVLPPQAVAQAAPDLTGIPPGARVNPGGCLPPPQDYGPGGTAMAVGTDTGGRATLSVEVTTPAEPLADYRRHLVECARVEATHRGVTATVTTALEPDPPVLVPGSETLALSRTVTSGEGPDALAQSILTHTAQLGDVRVLVTYMSFESGAADAENVDRVYADAVRYALEARPR
ncbi:sensor domain-containing protein [Rhodococcus sp. (in: high G+C Gram-positive bacteria)]|uniref:sensor domain-containing protein n=1 Tax=unclassified Rhodococcus (in: high G+C Gram-positive bacteria) TaxID=192944 RepID=UPI0025F4F195|nr:sensor domain-containing protein [Rhodococcus sp. (in: high G+C Gram-positive bacteria)]